MGRKMSVLRKQSHTETRDVKDSTTDHSPVVSGVLLKIFGEKVVLPIVVRLLSLKLYVVI